MGLSLYSPPMRNLLLLIVAGLLLNGCKNELEINAPWVETPVVYGFLDAYKDTQYIRIEKTYQNSVNQTTKEAAQIADSLYFDTLQVRVYSNLNEEYHFNKVALPKTPGLFENGTHYIYQCVGFKPGASGIAKKYWLEIKNPKSGKTYVSSSTSLVDSTRFGVAGNIMNITSPDVNGNIGSVYYKTAVGQNAKIYDLFIRLNYQENYTNGTSANKYLDYFIQKNWEIDNTIVSYQSIFKARTYVDFLKTSIDSLPTIQDRKYLSIVYYASGGTADLAFLTDLSQPSTTIVPKNTQYTNIPGALGIFSSLSINTVSPNFPVNNKVKETIVAEVPQFQP